MKWKGNITVGLGSGWLLGVGSSLRFLNQRGLSLSLSLSIASFFGFRRRVVSLSRRRSRLHGEISRPRRRIPLDLRGAGASGALLAGKLPRSDPSRCFFFCTPFWVTRLQPSSSVVCFSFRSQSRGLAT